MADIDATVGHITSAARDAVEALADQYAAELEAEKVRGAAALAALQAEFDAYKARNPEQEPEPEPPAVKIGASFKAGENLPAAVQSIDIHRYFFQPGDMARAQTWAGQPNLVKAHDKYGARTFSISFKPDSNSGAPFGQPDNIRRFLDTIPADVEAADVLLTFFHEHDGNIHKGTLSIDLYRRGSEQVAAIAHERGHLYGPIHNANVYDPAATPKWGLHRHVWAANEADVDLYDFWGADCYSDGYENPSPRMDALKDYADHLGLPLLIGELGAPNGPAQAAWAGKARTWALANTRWAAYWSSQINGETNYRLTDDAAKAWFGLENN